MCLRPDWASAAISGVRRGGGAGGVAVYKCKPACKVQYEHFTPGLSCSGFAVSLWFMDQNVDYNTSDQGRWLLQLQKKKERKTPKNWVTLLNVSKLANWTRQEELMRTFCPP